ncbi:DUF6093 family protein [Pseudoclavibacter helvolus]|uniref:Uncharacterized protein n=1 Tax=Pseudoclavibacter helvolus TaxID=255205 RepID=A0A7W4ULR8_9MICO|nr:DUF6093 family protein [Pseudoclavibacter helvolus]MBB2956790.1 hypothetical protein [Pseudoclavibacter helvolus]
MSVRGLLSRGRKHAARLRTETGTLAREGEKVWNEATGLYEEALVTVYTGSARVKAPTAEADARDSQGRLVVITDPVLHLPPSVLDVRPGDEFTVETSVYDGSLVGRKFRINEPYGGSQITARKFRTTEVIV